MKEIVITAKNNQKIKELKALISSAKARKNSGFFAVEGVRLCRDAVESGSKIISVFYTDEAQEKYSEDITLIKNAAVSCFSVSGEIMRSVSDTVTPQGVICAVKAVKNTFAFKKGGKYIALDTLQNPDNLGAVLRTAEALGIDGVVIYGGCDMYNPKALRASMGAVFRLPVNISHNLINDIETAKLLGIRTYACVPDRDALGVTDADFSGGAVCVIGNEGNGISKDIIDACGESVTIKMNGRAESLNAAAAAAIMMWEMEK
ncbi:MAG: RNA methyltransferase [Oscillospiraceae bacterium]|nr:RNA methyltransferase [Oscillospiraceae bacterium]